MKNSPEITMTGIVPVLSISPMEEDHFFLQNILNRLQGTLDPSRTFTVTSCATLASGRFGTTKYSNPNRALKLSSG
jgi:hypothetical protein